MSLLDETIHRIESCDQDWRKKAEEHLLNLTMPRWAMGRLLDLAVDLAGMTRSLNPPTERRCVVVMAADHGVTEEGVSAYPSEVTVQMIHNFVRGGACVNVLAEQAGARVVVVDVGVAGDMSKLVMSGKILGRRIAPGTRNMARGPAMTHDEAILALETGIKVAQELSQSTDLFATGEMGIGNTTASSAIVSVLCGVHPETVTGRGTGLSDEKLNHKTRVIEQALEVNQPDPEDPVGVLAGVGGFEIGGIAGLILGAASQRRPVIVDGFISTAGALLAAMIEPKSVDYMIAGHAGEEPGILVAWKKLGKRPYLDLNLRLGEGTGAVLAMHLVEAAKRIMTRLATFDQAGVCGEQV